MTSPLALQWYNRHKLYNDNYYVFLKTDDNNKITVTAVSRKRNDVKSSTRNNAVDFGVYGSVFLLGKNETGNE